MGVIFLHNVVLKKWIAYDCRLIYLLDVIVVLQITSYKKPSTRYEGRLCNVVV